MASGGKYAQILGQTNLKTQHLQFNIGLTQQLGFIARELRPQKRRENPLEASLHVPARKRADKLIVAFIPTHGKTQNSKIKSALASLGQRVKEQRAKG